MHIDLLTPSLSTKERLRPRLNVQSVAQSFERLTCSKGVPQVPQALRAGPLVLRWCGERWVHIGGVRPPPPTTTMAPFGTTLFPCYTHISPYMLCAV